MKNQKIYLSSPTMNGTEMRYIQEAFASNWIAPLGKNVDEFEKELAAYVGIGHAAALTSGTAALHLAIKLAGVKRGDIVFCSDLTFSATVNPVSYEGGIQVFIDSEPDTWNMDPEALQKAFDKYKNVKAVIVANLYGTPAKLDEITSICDRYSVPLIEDAAESLGATYKGRQTGTFGKYGIFSFNGNKIITSSGGGMLVSDDEEAVKKVRFWATQSRESARYYQHKEIGYNYRMSNIVAGVGRGQMDSLNDYVGKKKWIYETYLAAFEDIDGIRMNPYLDCSNPNFWLSCLTIDPDYPVKPMDVIAALENENIESRPIWKPMHLQPVFADRDFITMCEDGGSVGNDVFNSGLCLPSDIKNTSETMERIIGVVRDVVTVKNRLRILSAGA